jgi:hypothetical protein
MKFILILGFIYCFGFNVFAQDNIGVKFFGLSFHPKGEKPNAFLMPRKLDKDAYLVMNLGGLLSYEKFIYKNRMSIKAIQALYADCAVKLGGFSHIGIRVRILKTEKHSIYGGIGLTFIYRKNWLNLAGYNPTGSLYKGDENDIWQTIWLWYGGEFEYKYSFNSQFDLGIMFVPGYPDLMNLAAGLHYRF